MEEDIGRARESKMPRGSGGGERQLERGAINAVGKRDFDDVEATTARDEDCKSAAATLRQGKTLTAYNARTARFRQVAFIAREVTP